jgi:hypothetical protein
MTDKYFTIVFKDLTSEERVALWNCLPGQDQRVELLSCDG